MGDRFSQENHRGISSVNTASKLFARIIRHRSSNTSERFMREDQARFRLRQGCTDHIFVLRQATVHRYVIRELNFYLPLFESDVPPSRSWISVRLLVLNGMSENFISFS